MKWAARNAVAADTVEKGLCMLQATLTVQDVGYCETLTRIYPVLYYEILSSEHNHFLIQLLKKLEQDSLPICLHLLQRLSQQDRDELLVMALNAYSETICESINHRLQEDPIGRHLSIPSISAGQSGDRLLLTVEQISIDYQALTHEPWVQDKIAQELGSLSGFAKLAAQATVSASPDWLENKGISFLNQPAIQNRILRLAQDTLHKQGFVLTLTNLSLSKDADTVSSQILSAGFSLSPKLEDHILNAIADYLRSL